MLSRLSVAITAMFVLALCAAQPLAASENPFARAASDSIAPFLIAGEATLLLHGKTEGVQGAKAVVASGAVTQLLKLTVRSKRPMSNSPTSFPSGHTSAAFAMATALSDYNSDLRIPAFALATTIAWSRVELGAHRWHEVLAGAAIGYYSAKRYTKVPFLISEDGIDYTWKW